MFNVPFGQYVLPSAAQPRPGTTAGTRTERLNRLGYADGERQPRTPRHWANR